MKRIVILVALMLGISLLCASCEKQDASSFVGTWSFVEDGEKDEGDYVVITENQISFYYTGEDGFDNGVKYKFEYEHPHIFIAGINLYDVVSKSRNRMVWEDANDEEYSYSIGAISVSKEKTKYILNRK